VAPEAAKHSKSFSSEKAWLQYTHTTCGDWAFPRPRLFPALFCSCDYDWPGIENFLLLSAAAALNGARSSYNIGWPYRQNVRAGTKDEVLTCPGYRD